MKYILTILLFAGFVAILLDNPSKDYWESVGPSWDRMLNPCKYTECVEKE
jgi:hypothetical protein